MIRSDLKKVFWSHIGVGRSFQILEIPMYSSGWDPQAMIRQAGNPALAGKLAAALIWYQNSNFETASISDLKKVFCPHIGVDRSFPSLEIPMYSSGWDPQAMIRQAGNPALAGNLATSRIWNQNPNFETASIPRSRPYPQPTGGDAWP